MRINDKMNNISLIYLYNFHQKVENFSLLGKSLLMQDHNPNPKTQNPPQPDSPYFRLMQIVGAAGKYQTISLVVWCIMWLTTGTILLGTPFLMMNPPYTCDQSQSNTKNLSSQQCQAYVCSLPQSQRYQYLDQSSALTIANNFSDLHCTKSWIPDFLTSLVYMGCFFGYVSVSIMVDNMGRWKALLISYGVATLGMVVAVAAPNLYVVGIGLFLMGYGSDSAINICFYFITETMESKNRQKYSILIQVFFSLGGLVNVGYFYLLKNWRVIMLIFLIAPSIVCLVLVIKVIKDTPYFLVKLCSREKIISDLSQINRINNGQPLTQEQQQQMRDIILNLQQLHVQKVDQSPDSSKNHSRIYTPVDLFRYPSIRFISIAVCLLSLFIYILYYGPLMLISKLSFNMYINALVVTVSELVTYPLCFLLIHRIRRKLAGIVLYGVCGVSAFMLIFVIANLCQDGSKCSLLDVAQLVLIFVFRFCSSLEFAIFLVYTNEVFPTQIRGIGLGISSALGTVASTASPYIFGAHLTTNSATSHIMIVFLVLSLIGVFLWVKLPETLNMGIKDEIRQVAQGRDSANSARGGEGHIELVEVKQSD